MQLPYSRECEDTTLTHALLLVTTVEGQDIRPKTAELHLVPQAKEDKEVILLASDVAKRDTTRTSVRTMEVKAVEIKFETTNKILKTIRSRTAVKDNNMVNGMFLINNVYASVLFDTGADRSFVSYAFSKYIDIPPTTLDTNYNVELADRKSLTTNTILRGMGLMVEHDARSRAYEKVHSVSNGNEMLIVQGEEKRVKNMMPRQ
ncbi:reverse transcriptase domain-containing protein [Tanacetum coccineum]